RRRSGGGRSPGLGAWRSALLPGSRDLRPLLSGENAIPIFVAPAKARVQAWAHGALRFCLDPATYAHCCPEKMRYLSSSLRRRPESRLGRMALCAFAWIPTYAGTTMLLSLAKLKARGCSRFFAPIVVPAIFPRTVVGVSLRARVEG